MDKVQINAWMPRSLADSLREAGERDMTSTSAIVRRACVEHLERSRAVAPHGERARPIPAGTLDGAVGAGGAQRTEG
jgi:hypothetical protein